MDKGGIGAAQRRLEETRLLTGRGCYADDVGLPGQAYGVMLRSTQAHARLVSVDSTVASRMPGVLAILTGADVLADGLKPIPHMPLAMSPPDIALYNLDGSALLVERPPILATDSVRFVGEGVAFVVAGTVAEARDAAEAIRVAYDPLPPMTDIAVDARVGSPPATRAGFAEAECVVRLETHVQRVTGVPLEPRAAVGAFDSGTGCHTLHAGSGVAQARNELAFVLGVEPERVRVIEHDAGGDSDNSLHPEFVLVAWAARKVGRPVKWTGERGEAFLSDHAASDLRVEVELALSAEGRFLGLHATNTSDLGAYTASYVPLTKATQFMTSLYALPAVVRARAVLSNTQSTAPCRSAGRPETLFVIERLIDMAAREYGFDRVELRRRNLVPRLPHRNIFGITYDSGDYAGTFEAVLKLADRDGYAARQRQSAARGLKRGFGLGAHIESRSGRLDGGGEGQAGKWFVTYPSGWHVCEVEVDPETGVVRIDRYAAIGDAGRAPPPPVLPSGAHGGIAKAAGQALMEQVVHRNGELLTGSLMDYAVPRADDFPFAVTSLTEMPSMIPPPGLRGDGQGDIAPAPGVIVNAVVDALADYGVSHIEMPCTPERVWQAIRACRIDN